MCSDRKFYLIEFLFQPCPIPPYLYLFIYLFMIDGQATWISPSQMNLSYNCSKVKEVTWRMSLFPLQLDFEQFFYFAQMTMDCFVSFLCFKHNILPSFLIINPLLCFFIMNIYIYMEKPCYIGKKNIFCLWCHLPVNISKSYSIACNCILLDNL